MHIAIAIGRLRIIPEAHRGRDRGNPDGAVALLKVGDVSARGFPGGRLVALGH